MGCSELKMKATIDRNVRLFSSTKEIWKFSLSTSYNCLIPINLYSINTRIYLENFSYKIFIMLFLLS